jgi:formate dehydrogenase (NADP+) beta subunit
LGSVNLKIDGHQVETESGKTVLQAALDSDIYIPHLCYHPNLNPAGACRLCIVEIGGMTGIPTACDTIVTEGMVVQTKSARINRLRKLAMELLLVNHPPDCTSCPKYLNCELQSLKQYIGVNEGNRFKNDFKNYPLNTNNPLFVNDFNRCVLCGRCVRACNEFRGIGVLSFINKGHNVFIGTAYNHSLAEAGCKFCGACAEVCPTGSIRDQDSVLKSGKSRKASLVPCRYTCPAEIDIPRYLRFIRQKNYAAAVAVIREKVPFPLTLGYVCDHACESVCRRGKVNEPIAIKDLKRFVAELDARSWKQNVRKEPSTGKKVAVIGSGPAGLTTAYYLAKQGHELTVFESLPFPGGMLRVGIPEYRLPVGVLNSEIKQIEDAGVTIKTNIKVESPESLMNEGYDAVLVAIGTHQGKKLPIPGNDLDGVLVATSFLREVRFGSKVKVGEKVIVLGGGNVAFDCARTALRLGAKEVKIACLEPKERMLATPEEVACSEKEGIIVYNSQSFIQILGDNGRVFGVECLDVRCFEFDEAGKLSVECIDDSTHIFKTDTVIFAVGQRPEIPEQFRLTTGSGNTIQVNEFDFSTEKAGIFAAGDAVSGTASVVQAIASAHKAASAIDSYLGGIGDLDEKLAPDAKTENWLGLGDGFAELRREKNPCLSLEKKVDSGFLEPGFDEEATKEALRCLQCDLRLKLVPVRFWADYSS